MMCEYKSLTIGSGEDGPAIRLDQDLYNGSTASSITFNSPILVHGGEKYVDDMFECQNVEFYIY